MNEPGKPQPLNPPFSSALRRTLGLPWLSHPGFRLALWGVGAVLLGALLFAYVSAGEVYDYQDTVDGVHLPPVDAVVVLAGGRGRIAAAGDLWYRYRERSQLGIRIPGQVAIPHAPILYISGMGPQSSWQSFTRQLRTGILPILTPDDVILEKQSANTEENALYVIRYARERHWSRILLMTSSYHMKRAEFIFRQEVATQRFPLEIETLSVYQDPFEATEWRDGVNGIRVTLIEYLKLVWYQVFWRPEKVPT